MDYDTLCKIKEPQVPLHLLRRGDDSLKMKKMQIKGQACLWKNLRWGFCLIISNTRTMEPDSLFQKQPPTILCQN
jgi:hypothetical protein